MRGNIRSEVPSVCLQTMVVILWSQNKVFERSSGVRHSSFPLTLFLGLINYDFPYNGLGGVTNIFSLF